MTPHKDPGSAKLAELIAKAGYPADVADAVRADAERLGTVDKLVSGELRLPSVTDATNWHKANKQ